MMGCHDTADFAPNLGTVFTRCYACNIDACTTVALDDVVHGNRTGQAFMK